MWKLGLRPRYSFSGNICLDFSVLCLCSVVRSTSASQTSNVPISLTGARDWFLCIAGYLNVGAASSSPLGLLNLFSGSSLTSDQLACRVTCSGQSWVLSIMSSVYCVQSTFLNVQCSVSSVHLQYYVSTVMCLVSSVPCPVSKFTDL
jgi:hypothetical protein